MPDPQVDYDALASQHGGSPTIDYDALAAQNGGGIQKDKGTVIYKNTPQTTPEMLGSLAMGAIKQPGRLVQMIPGVTALTDKVYGLPTGASAKAMEPANTAEQVGGYAADLAELVGPAFAATGAKLALSAADVTRIKALVKGGMSQKAAVKAVVQLPTYASKAAGVIGDVSQGAVQAVKANIGVGGPITATKIGEMIGRYGYKAVKLGVQGAIGVTAGKALWDMLEGK